MSHFPDSPNLIIGWFKDELNAQAYKAIYGIKEKLTNYYHAHEFMTEDFNLIVDAVTDLLHKDRAEVRRDALLEAAKVERERIVKIVQGLLYEAESDAIGKPEYYDDVYLYKGIIDLIAEGQSQGKE